MKLLGHESMTTSQRYVTAAGTETRSAAARNGLYALIPGCANDADLEIWLERLSRSSWNLRWRSPPEACRMVGLRVNDQEHLEEGVRDRHENRTYRSPC